MSSFKFLKLKFNGGATTNSCGLVRNSIFIIIITKRLPFLQLSFRRRVNKWWTRTRSRPFSAASNRTALVEEPASQEEGLFLLALGRKSWSSAADWQPRKRQCTGPSCSPCRSVGPLRTAKMEMEKRFYFTQNKVYQIQGGQKTPYLKMLRLGKCTLFWVYESAGFVDIRLLPKFFRHVEIVVVDNNHSALLYVVAWFIKHSLARW